MKRLLFVAALLSILLVVGCGSEAPFGSDGSPTTNVSGESVTVPGGTYTRVSAEELKAMLESEDFPLVNVHIPFEGDIPDTDLSIPYDEIGHNLDRLPGKGTKIVLYCRSGSMSTEAARRLVQLGYENVWELEGGMNAWRAAGYRLEGT
ncbi:hypothetical protein Rxycam_02178 [Rubrobacter xylanophilus DSM 9941]|uniref:rhodanese-like domain-containing protein n=1 Tax=Rubrobacter xylanophilus TaxID=49319 RepID=UPI001C63DE25|nr:rhodanese-like domain-containing protein [Rubrobacter xylanophilus]QYJ16345.1 hypothetical protein Rxycam_02178 [Rubrobacter xylanophilus DSM 9941]